MKSDNLSVMNKKAEMYTMIMSIEEDFICNFREKLEFADIPQVVVESSTPVANEPDSFMATLRGLDIQAYIEICNANIDKLSITVAQRRFINVELSKIIPIRNKIMHPRPLEFFDYSMVNAVFQQIEAELNCFTWNAVIRGKDLIENHPEDLILPPTFIKKNERIIENLPSVLDYEETSFVGRNKEVAELRAKLNKKNVNILSVIGDGGVGKTAITLKLLYDMLDDPDCTFDIIIWTTLKTSELSNHSFKDIANSIQTTAKMYEELASFIGGKSLEDTKAFIIELAQNYNTLFVLDNLETLNTADIRDFIDEFSEYGKVLITSRIGLGEMEHRYKLTGLSENDVLTYVDILLELYGYSCLYTDERKKELFIDELHSNPLAIKWFVKCLYSGLKEEEILAKKEDVINFCMANVYDKLTSDARDVLDVLTVAGVELSFPELIYYLEAEKTDIVKIKYAINELGKCNFIDEFTYRRDKSVVVTDFAREFLSLHFPDVKHRLPRFKELKQQLSSIGQQLLINKSDNKFAFRAICYRGNAELVVASYLKKAVEAKEKEEALEMVRFAQELMPQFYENHLVLAKIYGAVSPLITEQEYKNALQYCNSNEDLIRSYMLYSDFLIRVNDYSGAINMLSSAEELDGSVVEIKFQKAKVHCYMGQYDAAEKLLTTIDPTQLSTKDFNKLQVGYADVHRRRSEKIDLRETQHRLHELREAYACLEKCTEPDSYVFDYISKLLEQISYLYFDNAAINFALEILQKHYKNVRKANHYGDFVENISKHFVDIKEESLKKAISKYVTNFNNYLSLLSDNEVVVYNLKQGYGFGKSTHFPSGVYFSMRGALHNVDYGDILSFSSVLETDGKFSLIKPQVVGKMMDRIEKSFQQN